MKINLFFHENNSEGSVNINAEDVKQVANGH